MAIQKGLSVLGPETLWLDFPSVGILFYPWITVSRPFVRFPRNSTVVLLVIEFSQCHKKVHKTRKVWKCLRLPFDLTDTHYFVSVLSHRWESCWVKQAIALFGWNEELKFKPGFTFSCQLLYITVRKENPTMTLLKHREYKLLNMLVLQVFWVRRQLL